MSSLNLDNLRALAERFVSQMLQGNYEMAVRQFDSQMKTAIPYNVMMQRSANIGMYSGTTLCNPIGQRMLSTKHFLRNTITQRYTVRMLDLSVINSDGDNIFLLLCQGVQACYVVIFIEQLFGMGE